MIAHMSVDKAGVSADQDQVSAFSQFQTHSSLHSDVKAGALHFHLPAGSLLGSAEWVLEGVWKSTEDCSHLFASCS